MNSHSIRVFLSVWVCRAQSFAERLRLGIAVIHGEAQDAESDQVDGRHSPPTVKTTGAIHPSMEIPCNAHTHKHAIANNNNNNNTWHREVLPLNDMS